jgi:hypothetical protein
MKTLALILSLSMAACATVYPHVKPALNCALVDFESALPQILMDLGNWAALDADAIKFGEDVLICALRHITATKGTAAADDRAAKAKAYLDARGY